jgi:beta-phosphoglucomutase-like phosphatase (HAD superfamily)
MIKALIFDFDGLIIDSESPEFQVWQEVFAEHGRELGFDLWADLIGRPRTHFDVYAYFCENINPGEQLRKDRRARVVALTLEQPVLPGVHDYLCGAAQLGLKIGLASSSSGGPRTRSPGASATAALFPFDQMFRGHRGAQARSDSLSGGAR